MGVHPEQLAAKKKQNASVHSVSLIIALIAQVCLLAILYLEEAPPPKKDKYTQAKEDYWASR